MTYGARWPSCAAPGPTTYSPTSGKCWALASTARQAGRGSARPCRRSILFPTSPTDMNQRHAVVLSLAVAACGGCGGGPKIALRFHPPAGAVYHYALEQRAQISILSGPLTAMGKQHFFLRMPFTQTVKGPAREGGTEVEVVFESLTMEIPGVSPDRIARELAKVNGLRTTVVYDERGQIVRSNFVPALDLSPDVANQVETGIKAMTLGFPQQTVGRGDAWSITSEL